MAPIVRCKALDLSRLIEPSRFLAKALLGLVFVISVTGCEGVRAARLYTQGTHALDRGETQEAIRDLEAAGRLAPDRSEVYNHLGIAYTEAGRLVDARKAFERAVDLDCTNHAALANLEHLQASESIHSPPAGP